MCPDCWQSVVDDRPTCQPCVPLLTRPVPVVVPVVGAALALLVLIRVGWVTRSVAGGYGWAGVGFAAVLAAISAWRLTARANRRRRDRDVAPRPRELDARRAAAGHPYRGALRRSGRRLAPPVSGTMAAFVVVSALVITAATTSTLLRLPRWLELELVLAGWWLTWTVALSVLLYRGWRVAEDAP